MNILRNAQKAIEELQRLIDSGKDDGDLAVVIIHDKAPIEVAVEEKPALTGPNQAQRDDDYRAEEDLLDQFIKDIEYYLTGWGGDGFSKGTYCKYLRPSATEVEVRIDVEAICDFEEGADDDEEVRSAFYEELPNIVKIYEKAGWDEVFFEGDGDTDPMAREGELVFKGKITSSSYRKMLEDGTDASEDAKLTSPKEAQA